MAFEKYSFLRVGLKRCVVTYLQRLHLINRVGLTLANPTRF